MCLTKIKLLNAFIFVNLITQKKNYRFKKFKTINKILILN